MLHFCARGLLLRACSKKGSSPDPSWYTSTTIRRHFRIIEALPKLTLGVGAGSLSLQSQTQDWQASVAVRAEQDRSKIVAALATCSSFNDGKIHVKVNEGSTVWGGKGADKAKHARTATRNMPLILQKVFEKELNSPLSSTVVLDLSVLESDDSDAGAMSINATSLALYSTVFQGQSPVGGVHVAILGDEVVVSPSTKQMAEASMNMIYAGRKGSPLYFHACGKASLQNMVAALRVADLEASRIAESIAEYIKENRKERDFELRTPEDLVALVRIRDFVDRDVDALLGSQNFTISEFNLELSALKSKCTDYFRKIGAFRSPVVKIPGSGCVTTDEVDLAFEQSVKAAVTERILSKGSRIDGRSYDATRQMFLQPERSGLCAISAGGTKLISTVKCTAAKTRQTFECTSNLAISSAPSFLRERRRHLKALEYDLIQVGLGSNLSVEKALFAAIPDYAEFPFSIKLKCQALSMDGSFPMLSVCASSIALANAGVPMDTHVAGLSVGILNQEEGDPIVILDPVDLEEHLVDGLIMLTSAESGMVTSASLEGVKSKISIEKLIQSLERAQEKMKDTLTDMGEVCPLESNPHQGSFFEKVTIPKEAKGKLIGPGGRNIRQIEALTGVTIAIAETDDSVSVYGDNSEGCKNAIGMIMKSVGAGQKANTVEGQSYKGEIIKVLDFGAVMSLDDGGEGWIHISEIQKGHVKKVGDVLSVGQVVDAICIGRNAKGSTLMSLKQSRSYSKLKRKV